MAQTCTMPSPKGRNKHIFRIADDGSIEPVNGHAPEEKARMRTADGGLTLKEKDFVEEYLLTRNGTRSAIRAGYPTRSASVIASKLLDKDRVQAAIVRGLNNLQERRKVTRDELVDELAKLVFTNMQDYVVVNEDGDVNPNLAALTREQWAALSEISIEEFMDGHGQDARPVRRTKFKLYDRKGAIMDLAKLLGLYQQSTKLVGPGGGPIQVAAVNANYDVSKLDTNQLRQLHAALMGAMVAQAPEPEDEGDEQE